MRFRRMQIREVPAMRKHARSLITDIISDLDKEPRQSPWPWELQKHCQL